MRKEQQVKAVAPKGKARELKSKSQHAMPCPLRFLPYLRPMVWGGRRLGDVLGKPLPGKEPYGESWEISDHALHHSEVATGPWAGRTLRQLMEQECAVLLGAAASQHAVFPWLVKFLDACDWLSVQVHPDEESVRRLWPGEGSKTEAWFVLEAAPESRIYAGLLPGIDEPRLREALATQSVADCLHHFEPHPGDCVFLPAGTVHAVGGACSWRRCSKPATPPSACSIGTAAIPRATRASCTSRRPWLASIGSEDRLNPFGPMVSTPTR